MLLTLKPSRSSFRKNWSNCVNTLLSWWIVVLKWFGHALVMSFSFTCSWLSSLRLGMQRCFNHLSSFLLVFSMNLLIHGVYAGTTWCVVPWAVHHAHTSLLFNRDPTSVMNVSGVWKVWVMALSPSKVVLAIPLVLNLKPHMNQEYVLIISKTEWYPPLPLGKYT